MAAAYKRGLQQPQIGPDLHGGGGMLMFWSHEPVAPWQDEAWLSDMRRSLRPNQYLRMIENRFVTSESQFIDMAAWDACVQASLTPSMERVPVWIGVDASTKRDSTALVAVSFDKATSCVRLVAHRVFTPTAGDPIEDIGGECVRRIVLLPLHEWLHVRGGISRTSWPRRKISRRPSTCLHRSRRPGLKRKELQNSAPPSERPHRLFDPRQVLERCSSPNPNRSC